jgi:hypothetical protein
MSFEGFERATAGRQMYYEFGNVTATPASTFPALDLPLATCLQSAEKPSDAGLQSIAGEL